MSNEKNDSGGPAFPEQGPRGKAADYEGMSIRQYAAIHLQQPDSGTDWKEGQNKK